MTFVRNHAKSMCDFLVSITAAFQIFYVFVAMEIGSRRIPHFNVTMHPTAEWTTQQFREILDTSASTIFAPRMLPGSCRWCCGRVGDAVAPAGRCEGAQKILADEVADEARSTSKTKPSGQRRRPGFCHSAAKLKGGFDKVMSQLGQRTSESDGHGIDQLVSNQRGVWAGRFERPPPLRPRRISAFAKVPYF